MSRHDDSSILKADQLAVLRELVADPDNGHYIAPIAARLGLTIRRVRQIYRWLAGWGFVVLAMDAPEGAKTARKFISARVTELGQELCAVQEAVLSIDDTRRRPRLIGLRPARIALVKRLYAAYLLNPGSEEVPERMPSSPYTYVSERAAMRHLLTAGWISLMRDASNEIIWPALCRLCPEAVPSAMLVAALPLQKLPLDSYQ